MKLLLPLLLLIFAGATFGQSDLPELGEIKDITGKTKFYLSADAVNHKPILKEISKNKPPLEFVNKPTDAEFFIEYKMLTHERVTSLDIPAETGQMDIYFYRESKKVVVWSKSSSASFKMPSVDLIRKFLKEFKKLK